MDKLLEYVDTTDQEVFLQQNLDDLSLSISACTVANSDGKPNEDAFAAVRNENQIWLAVFDGTTSLKAIPSLGSTTGARFASHFLKSIFSDCVSLPNILPREVFIRINNLLLEKSLQLGGDLSDTHTLPASLATIVNINTSSEIISFAHIGDTFGIKFTKDDKSLVFTDDKNMIFDQGMFDLMKKISVEKGITIKQSRQSEEVKKALYEMFIKKNNNPDGTGSGLVNGDPNMIQYLQTGGFPLSNVKSILLATDGLEIQGHNLQDSQYRSYLLSQFKSRGFTGLIKLKKDSEDADPDWNNIRYKHSDDATGIMVEFTK